VQFRICFSLRSDEQNDNVRRQTVFFVVACVVDIALIIDSSSSVGNNSWESLVDFMVTFVSALDIGTYKTSVAVVSYGMHYAINHSIIYEFLEWPKYLKHC